MFMRLRGQVHAPQQKTILELNNEKLGNTQISNYLRELKNEGLIDE
jgi:hypothetical protein